MEERHPNLIVARKDYTPFPINATGLFKPKDLYLLAGMYLSSEYYSDASYLYTNVTVNQLSALTGVSEDYISNNFYPRLKRSGFIRYRCIQEQPLVRRNHFYLPNPTHNFRFIRKEFFFDRTISPEEKGVMIGLYCICIMVLSDMIYQTKEFGNHWVYPRTLSKSTETALLTIISCGLLMMHLWH